jgi:hypothetical protein
MASSTSTMGTRQSRAPSGASHSLTSSTCGRSSTVTATRAVQSPENDPSNPSTTSAWSAITLPASAQAAHAPSGSHDPSSATHWPSR